MKIALVYNHDTKNVINLFGIPNREIIGQKTIKRISDALKAGKHQVKAIEGDKDLVDKLEEFMPRVLKGEQPGLAFNVSYGIQGQARYTHVPSILEMVGIPYVGSGPLAHGLALDKVVAKMLFQQYGIPTPEFAVLDSWENELPDLMYPLIVKPKNEAVSFGLQIVHSDEELRHATQIIIEKFKQAVLVERYIEGREINVGLIGNNPPETFAPVELNFGPEGPAIYTYEDKTRRSGREIGYLCPAPIGEELADHAQQIARRAFEVLGCYDCARVDMRLDQEGRLYVLEINSLPSLGEHGSYLIGAEYAGLDFKRVINRLVEVASARYFGTPKPHKINFKDTDSGSLMLSFLTGRRDQIERRIETWTHVNSRSADPIGVQEALKRLNDSLENIGLKPVPEFTDNPFVKTWQTNTGISGGTLLIGHLDIPLTREVPSQSFRRDPEYLYGEGVGLSRSPLVMLEFVLRGLKHIRRLQRLPLGVMYYTDEGQDCIYSADIIQQAASQAKQVFILRPGNPDSKVIVERRGQRRYTLRVETPAKRLGKTTKNPEALRWVCAKIEELSRLSSRKDRVAIAASDIKPTAFPMLLPHRVLVKLLVSYSDEKRADLLENEMRNILGQGGVKWELEMISQRPPLKLRKENRQLFEKFNNVAQFWEIPLEQESSLWPTAAGLIPPGTPVLCGVGPVACNLYTPQESVQRISVIQRTLLLAEFLVQELNEVKVRT